MARTILDIAVEAAERDATAPAPRTLFGTNDRIAKILRGAAKDTMREYLRSTRAQGLSEFQGTWVFATRPGRFAYPLPPDYLRMIPNTEHLGGAPLGVLGPATPQSWAWWIRGGAGTATPAAWLVQNNMILLNPTPATADLVQIGYISRYPVASRITSDDMTIEGSTPVVNAPFVSRDGYLAPGATDVIPIPTDGVLTFDTEPGYDTGTWPAEPSEILRRLNLLSTAEPYPMVRRPEFTADTDLPAFDDDFPLSLGMTFRLRRALGLSYAEHAAEYDEELEAKMAGDAGGPRSFLVGHSDDDRTNEVIPLGGGVWLAS